MAKVKSIPEGLHSLTVQLSVEPAAEAIELYKKAFGAVERSRAMDPTGKKIWHAELRIGDSAIFVNDIAREMGGKQSVTSMWLYVEGVDAAFERAKAAGMTVGMPPMDMFWGDRMGMLKDRFGIDWNLAERVKEMTPEEMMKAQDEFVKQMAAKK